MTDNKTIIQCPECGSKKTRYINDGVFECLSCSTSFYVENNNVTVNHKHTYNNVNVQKKTNAAPNIIKYILIALGVIFVFSFIIPSIIGSKQNKSTSVATSKEDFAFNKINSTAFVDKSGALKVFITGEPNSSDNQNKKYEKEYFWAVYDPLKNSFDQINKIENVNMMGSYHMINGTVFRFDDGNIYFILNNNILYKYDIEVKDIQPLNDEMIATIPELKSGIKSIEAETSKYSSFKIKSNTRKEVWYYPISKVYNLDDFRYHLKKHSYPNDKPTTFFFQTHSEPSYLVKYTAMYSMGYPFCFDPYIDISLDENENFKSASFASHWKIASRLIDLKVLNPDNKLYKTTVLDFRDGIVAMGVKTTNSTSANFILQWLDYDGNLLWSTPIERTSLYSLSGALSQTNGILFKTSLYGESYLYYNNKGEHVRTFKIEELRFNLD